ncbi:MULTISPECIES: tyrosine-type recombinase/integrase [Pseudonocardia]|uniref:Site-specific recombinase XerD n=2 Tax=Pseudonocardia TaxID=1847 RepID=A0ABQ0RXL6_9PSEU|nr:MULTISPECIES: tyrosine-type recombinase/integrase [Pseudonocardia]OSY36114.1 putative prophage phiRv2 integrase [Pseudonocardia autotrophica]TDN77596.1 site-specific recombinase XerD [Pseudonocardia autotrophica]BBG01626.1 hypothetical protein Pdca_28350 [Pseudonocardia autotrophica]GEC25371.1 hypothetical protein PSA01_24000 [Pseudonocardia saturnea]
MASIKRRPNGTWRARYRDETGHEHARHFDRKIDAQRWLDEVTTSIITGNYVDPRAGKTTLRTYTEDWRTAQPHSPLTRARIERELRLHIYPAIGDTPIARLRPTTIQALISGLPLAPSSTGNILDTLRQIFKAARRDRLLTHDPTDGVRAPTGGRTDIWIPTPQHIRDLHTALPDRYKTVVDLVVGAGLRQAEVTGLEVRHLDFLRGRDVTVAQQLMSLTPTRLTEPKTSESLRAVPLAQGTLDALSAHLAAHPATPVDLDDETNPRAPTRRPVRLVFTTTNGHPITRGTWSGIWGKAAREAGFPKGSGLHSLRHFYASALIRFGESAKVVQRRLGHASVEITLRTYTHLWPDSDDRTREAVASVLEVLADPVRTAVPGRVSDLQG